MSLILDALRKSEAERRRGQPPDLHAELPPAAQQLGSARPAWHWPALAIVALAAMGWALGPWSPPRPVDPSAKRMAQSAAVDGAVVADKVQAGRANRDAAIATTVADAPPPRLDSPRLDGAPSALRPEAVTTNSSLASAATAPPRPADPAAKPPGDGTAKAARVAAPMMQPGAAIARPIPQTPQPPPTIAKSVSTAPPSIADDPATAAPLRLSDLSAAERLELPALKMSMHMWGPTTGERFAIIDGARVNEGDRLGDAVVEEITARAVVLAWRGQRLQIPLR